SLPASTQYAGKGSPEPIDLTRCDRLETSRRNLFEQLDQERADPADRITGRQKRLRIVIRGARRLIVIVISGVEINHVGVKIEHLQSRPVEAESRHTEP